ncbi:MAG TPA: protein phosphatase 2C domain-containing protein [Mycobacteriales bacterium]|nr:protein phosphatase 2C domain-containing protein [Mycobacteriales bacterium]
MVTVEIVTAGPPLRPAAATATGLGRAENQDALALADRVIVVADGVGGQLGGQLASAAAAPALRDALVGGATLGQAFTAARDAVEKAAFDAITPSAATTAVVAWLPEGSDALIVGHIGDSRAGVLDGDGFRWLTVDHNVAADLVRAGELTEPEAFDHWGQHSLTRVIGQQTRARPEDTRLPLSVEPQRLLLCSDGLSGYVEPEAIAVALAVGEPEDAVRALIDATYAAGAPDNVTVAVCDLPPSG